MKLRMIVSIFLVVFSFSFTNAQLSDDFCEEANWAERPELTGEVIKLETENFVMHYTIDGRDGARPSYVEVVQDSVEKSLDYQVDVLGLPLPPNDCGEGGDERFDIYIMNIDIPNVAGYARPDRIIDDNPNTELRELYSAYGHIVIENDMDGAPLEFAYRIVNTVVAHELHHNIQFGYDFAEPLLMLSEASATWIETQIYPELDGYSFYLEEYMATTDYCMGYYDDDLNLRVYGEWLHVDSMIQDMGIETLRLLWEGAALTEDLGGFRNTLRRMRTRAEEVLTRSAIRSLLWDFEQASFFRDRLRIEANLNGIGTVTPRTNGVQELGFDTVYITTPGVYELTSSHDNIDLIVVGVDQFADTATVFELEQNGTVDTTPYQHAYILVINTDYHNTIEDCNWTDWEITVEEGDPDNLTPPEEETWDASKFTPAG